MITVDNCQITINIDDVSFYCVKGDHNVICKNSNVSISEATPYALDKWQCILLDKYNHLDVFCQAKLLIYADELIVKSGISL